jgi:hypothetical protein
MVTAILNLRHDYFIVSLLKQGILNIATQQHKGKPAALYSFRFHENFRGISRDPQRMHAATNGKRDKRANT